MDNTHVRICTKCEKPGEFSKRGNGALQSWCKLCVREYSKSYYLRTSVVTRRYDGSFNAREYYRSRNQEYKILLAQMKKKSVCADCGGTFPAPCLEFDHVLQGKQHDLSQMKHYNVERVQRELALCEIVCCNCHRLRTATRRPPNAHNSQPAMLNRLLSFRRWMQEVKNEPCIDCGSIFPSVVMDFDHVRGVKIKGVSAMWSWSRSRVMAEIAKCDLVCANCHRLRTERRAGRLAA